MSEILVGTLDDAGSRIAFQGLKMPKIADIQFDQLILMAPKSGEIWRMGNVQLCQ